MTAAVNGAQAAGRQLDRRPESSRRTCSTLLFVFLNDARRHPGSAVATSAAMAIGVGVFVAIYLAGAAARSSFVTTVEALAGKATHQLRRDGGLAPSRLLEVLAFEGVESAQPVIETLVRVVGIRRDAAVVGGVRPPLRLLGIDPFFSRPFLLDDANNAAIRGEDLVEFLTRPGSVILPRPWADEAGALPGDTLEVAARGRTLDLTVLGVYDLAVLGEAGRSTAVLDIASAAEAVDRPATLDRFDLIVDEDKAASVRASLAPGERLERPAERGERVARMIDAFRLNLLALGTLALIVGAVLVFNAAQFSVVRRKALLGQLRLLGAHRELLVGAILAEVALFAAVGTAAGLGLGVLLARTLVAPLSRTIGELYAFVRIDTIPVSAPFGTAVIAAGLLVALLAALFPALEAAGSAPRSVGVRSREEHRFRSRMPLLILLAFLAAVASLTAVVWPGGPWWAGLFATLGVLLAGAFLCPPFLAVLLPRAQRLFERRGLVAAALAAGAILRGLSRTGAAAAALTLALSMTIGVIVMVSSFESEVRRWIRSTLRADVFIADGGQALSPDDARIPSAALEVIRSLEGVRAVDTLRGLEVPFGEGSIFFCGVEMNLPESWNRLELIEGTLAQAQAALRDGAVLLSEPLSRHHDLEPGDVLTLQGRSGTESFPVAGIFRDFSLDRGYAFTNTERFTAAFGQREARNAAVYLEPGRDAEDAAAELRRLLGGAFLLEVRSNALLRKTVLAVFDRTFAVTYLLQVISTTLALVGVSVTLLALFLERAHEVATLRALGASQLQVGRLFATEALFLGGLVVVCSLPIGAALAWILIDVVNLRAFGWTIHFRWPWFTVLATAALAVGAGLVATAVPLLFVHRQDISAVLREE